MYRWKLTGLLIIVLALPAWALSLDEVVRLSRAGVADEVILTQMSADGTSFQLSADDILNLRAQGVSDTVIAALIRNGNGRVPVAPVARRSDTNILLVHEGSANLGVTVDPTRREILYSDRSGNVTLRGGETQAIYLSPGRYTVRWDGFGSAVDLDVPAGSAVRVVTWDQNGSGGQPGVAVDIYRDGGYVGGGSLRQPRHSSFSSPTRGYDRRDRETEIAAQQPVNITVRNDCRSAPPVVEPSCGTVPAALAYEPQVRAYRHERTPATEQTYIEYAQPGPRTVVYEPQVRAYRHERTPATERTYIEYAPSSPGYPAPAPAYANTERPGLALADGDAWQRALPGPRTLVGAGLGAVIGHQYRKRDQGAAVGAGLGYLLDQFMRDN